MLSWEFFMVGRLAAGILVRMGSAALAARKKVKVEGCFVE
jgi:hypothetical protein